MGSWWNAADRGKKSVLMLLCPTQILHGLAWDQTWASTVTGQQLTAGTLAQSIIVCNIAILILIYIQQDSTLHSLRDLSANCSTCFGWYHHPTSGAQSTVSTTSGICHTVTATCRYRGRVGTGLSVHNSLRPVSTLPR
jgi:hypothetical protein